MTRRALLTASLLYGAPPLRLTNLEGLPEVVDPAANRATVFVFVSTVCPISKVYEDRLEGLQKRYHGQPVRFLFVNSNDDEPLSALRPGPNFKDWNNAIADRFDARLTPEAVVLDRQGAVRYQGAIDDSKNPARVKVEAVRLVVDALLKNEPTTQPNLRSFGCAIKRKA